MVGLLEEIEAAIGYRFEDRRLLCVATRSEPAPRRQWERLEFLGDSVLAHAFAELLLEAYPNAAEGHLTRLRAYFVRSESLASKARMLGLDRLCESEETGGEAAKRHMLEDCLEALIGAVQLDGGWDAARKVVENLFSEDLRKVEPRELVLADPKSALQEAAQARGLPLPVYRLVSKGGTEHEPSWIYEVVWDGKVVGRGTGGSKKAAQVAAARSALERLGLI